MSPYLDSSAIVGVAEAGIGDSPGLDEIELHAVSGLAALGDSGLPLSAVDGVLSVANSRQLRRPALAVSEYLGVRPAFVSSLSAGGASPLMLVLQAMAAINAGQCNVCIVTYGSTQRRDRSRRLGGDLEPEWMPRQRYEVPHGLPTPLGAYALAAQRYLQLYGADVRGMAAVAVAARQWGALTPGAVRTEAITVDDVLNSPMLSSPLRKLDCCLVTDGAASIVVARSDRLADVGASPVRVIGGASEVSHEIISQMPDLLSPGSDRTIPRALSEAGLAITDVDVACLYDSFTITVLLLLDSTGICGKGEAAEFVLDGGIAPGGSFPINTTGGGLAYAHPGINGSLLLVEAVRQLRGGLGPRQVAGASTALCHAVGGVLSSHCTLVLGS